MTEPSATDPRPVGRRLRSFVRREGRYTDSQRRAVEQLLPRYGVPPGDAPIDPAALFGRDAPLTVEVGFGNGEALLALAEAEPAHNFIGIEVYRPGQGRVLARVEQLGLRNVRVSGDDAVELIEKRIADASLDRVLVFFPDPWPKKRHHKRRLIQPRFAATLADKLRPGGRLYLATDWRDYAQQMLAVLDATDGLVNCHGTGRYAPRFARRPPTRFEQRGQRLGHPVWDLAYQRPGQGAGQGVDQGVYQGSNGR